MAIEVVSTLTDQYANSYVDADYADDYFAQHFSSVKRSTWEALDDDQKSMLLVAATAVIETIRFTADHYKADYATIYDTRAHVVRTFVQAEKPVRYNYYQALQFPRNLDTDFDTNLPFIPEAVKMAQCEQAIYICTMDESAMTKQLSGIGSEATNIGGQIQYSVTFTGGGRDATALAPLAAEFLKPYVVKGNSLKRA